jgi:O-antigen ligase
LVYAFASSLWSANPTKVLVTSGHLLGHYSVAVAGLLMFRGNEVSLIRVYAMFSYVFIPACLVTVFLFPDRNVYAETGRWMALTWNPNALGAAAMICVWANISYLLYSEKLLMRLWIISILAGAFMLLIGSGSVTSVALSSFILISVPIFYWFANSRTAVSAAFKIIYSCLIVFGVMGYFYATQPELFDPNRVLGTVGRDTNLTGRTTLWAIADAAITERPWLGWSFDALQSLPTKYSIKYNQFHNGYLDLLVRGGRVGLAFIILFATIAIFRIIRLAPIKKRMSAGFGALLIAILLHNTAEASLASAPNPLWLLFSFLYIGISPRIVKWYETGVLEKTKPWSWGRSTKTPLNFLQENPPQAYGLPPAGAENRRIKNPI